MGKTLGQLLDEFAINQGKDWNAATIYLYEDKDRQPHCVITHTDQDYDWTDVFTLDYDLNKIIKEKQATVASLNAKVKQLEKTEKDLRKALKLLVRVNDMEPSDD